MYSSHEVVKRLDKEQENLKKDLRKKKKSSLLLRKFSWYFYNIELDWNTMNKLKIKDQTKEKGVFVPQEASDIFF